MRPIILVFKILFYICVSCWVGLGGENMKRFLRIGEQEYIRIFISNFWLSLKGGHMTPIYTII